MCIRDRYYAAQVYSLLGLDTPDYELYDDGTDLTLISNYMRGMSEPDVYKRQVPFGGPYR